MTLAEYVDAGAGPGSPRARHHGEPWSPLSLRARLASRQQLEEPTPQPPLGDGGPERAEPGATYGDRRAMRARPRAPRPGPGVNVFRESH
jgi:hypothetical protein